MATEASGKAASRFAGSADVGSLRVYAGVVIVALGLVAPIQAQCAIFKAATNFAVGRVAGIRGHRRLQRR